MQIGTDLLAVLAWMDKCMHKDNGVYTVNVPEDDHSDMVKARAKHQHCGNKVAEQVIQEPAPMNILMITLWVLDVKCKLEESLKK